MTHLQFVKTSIKHFQAMYFIQFYYTFYTNEICLFCTICSDNCTIWKHLSAVSTMICLILTIFKRKIDDITSNYHLTLGESIWKKINTIQIEQNLSFSVDFFWLLVSSTFHLLSYYCIDADWKKRTLKWHLYLCKTCSSLWNLTAFDW